MNADRPVEQLRSGNLRTMFTGIPMRVGLGLVVGLLLVWAFIRLVDLRGVLDRVGNLNVVLALLCGVLFMAAYVVRALRWRTLLAPVRLSLVRASQIYFVAIFVNWLLPVRGGEFAKSLLLRRLNDVPISQSLPTVTADKAMDLLPAAILLILLPFLPIELSQPLWIVLVVALALLGTLAGVVGFAAWRRDSTVRFLRRLLGRLLPTRAYRQIEPFMVRFLDALIGIGRRPRLLAIAAGYTAVAVVLDAAFCWAAFRAVGADLSLSVVLYGYTLYNLAYLLPTPPGQIGSNEVVGLLVFSGLFGVSNTAVGAMFLFSHPWTAILMALAGLGSLAALGLGPRGMLRLWRDPTPASPGAES